jgi:NAD(P)H dehydrogenase (quinone)
MHQNDTYREFSLFTHKSPAVLYNGLHMILITGAGGKTGRTLVKAVSKIESVCALVHREEHIPILKSLGAEKIILGDMRDDDAIRFVMQGVRAAYHICPNMSPDEMAIGKLVIEEARKVGVEHFVYHSVLHPQVEKMNHHWQKMRVEEMIFESGLPFTILQPAPYMQNLLAGWKSIVEDGVLRVPYSVDSKFSFIDLEDLAEAAKIILTEANHKNAIYELVGTMPMSHMDVAEIIGHVLKREVRAESEEIRDWRLRAKGLSGYAVENLVRMFEYYDQWGLVGNPNVLRLLLKREPTKLQSFIEKTM